MKAWSLALLFTLIACAESSTPSKPTTIASADPLVRVKQVQRLIGDGMKDPESARFREIEYHAGHKPGAKAWWAVCGQVNAKNSFGGYVGFRPFNVVYTDGFEKPLINLATENTDDSDSKLVAITWDSFCGPESIKVKVQ